MEYLGRKDFIKSAFKTDIFKFRIGDLAQMTGVSTRQLRYWESKGIIESLSREGEQNARVYNYATYHRVQLIKDYLDEGYTLQAAVGKVNDIMSAFAGFADIIYSAVQGVDTIDNQRMVDLGYFDEAKTQRLWASIDDNKEVHYHVKPVEDEQ